MGDRCMIKCKGCHLTQSAPVESTVDHKVIDGVVYVKVTDGFLRNPYPQEGSTLSDVQDFYYTNAFRMMHPVVPTRREEVFVVGRFTAYPPWEKSSAKGSPFN